MKHSLPFSEWQHQPHKKNTKWVAKTSWEFKKNIFAKFLDRDDDVILNIYQHWHNNISTNFIFFNLKEQRIHFIKTKHCESKPHAMSKIKNFPNITDTFWLT